MGLENCPREEGPSRWRRGKDLQDAELVVGTGEYEIKAGTMMGRWWGEGSVLQERILPLGGGRGGTLHSRLINPFFVCF